MKQQKIYLKKKIKAHKGHSDAQIAVSQLTGNKKSEA